MRREEKEKNESWSIRAMNSERKKNTKKERGNEEGRKLLDTKNI